MKHFLNHEMLAPNVLTVAVDRAVVNQFADLARTAESDPDYCIFRPPWGSDIRWISAQSSSAFDLFQSAFDRLDVARYVAEFLDLDGEVRLYAGFLHTRSRCTETNFHVDWGLTNNEAFTLLTPVQGAENQTLLYKKLTGETAQYA